MEKIKFDHLHQSAPSFKGTRISELSRIQNWLRIDKRVLVLVNPIDSWSSWKYSVLMEDKMCPFYEPEYDKFNEFETYEDALEAGLIRASEILN